MRNLRKYPITLYEIENCLKDLEEQITKQNETEENIGDMRPLLLRAARKIVVRTGFVTFDLGTVEHTKE